MNAQFRNQHLPIANWLGKNLQLVPDAQQFQKPAEISLDFPFFVFVHEVDEFVNGWVIFQEIPQPGNALNEKMPPVVHQISAVDYLFIPIFRIFQWVSSLYPAGNAGFRDIIALFVQNASLAEEKPEAPAQRINGSIFPSQHDGVFPNLHRIGDPFSKSLGLFRPEILILNLHFLTFSSGSEAANADPCR